MASSRLPKRRRGKPTPRAAARRFTRSPWMVVVIAGVCLAAVAVIIAFSLRIGGDEGDVVVDQSVPTVEPSHVCASGAVPVDGNTCGDEDAPVKIIEYSNYQCSYCGRFARETKPEIEREYVATGKVQLEFRNVAAEGQASGLAAEAAECANEQGRFWAYHDMLYENQQNLSEGALKGFAGELGLDREAFDECLDSHKYTDLIRQQREEAAEAGVEGTPSFLVNGELVRGYLSFEDFRPIIERALAKAQEEEAEATPEASEPTPSTEEAPGP
ncbi:MAG: DsbA family protein [Dehalococcoidia bacterium]